MKVKYTILVGLLLFFTACGSSSNSDSSRIDNSSANITGKFIDDPVAGLKYKCSSGDFFETNENGEYTCKIWDDVTFSIGDLSLGTVTAKKIVTPYSLFPNNTLAAINLARLLQSLNNKSNTGIITIDKALTTSVTKDINLTSNSFEQDIKDKIGINLISTEKAKSNMDNAIIAVGGDVKEFIDRLTDATIIYTSLPTLNQELNITIEENDNSIQEKEFKQEALTNQYTWSVVSQPTKSDLVLTPSADTKSVTCTPTVAGKYVLKIISLNGIEKTDTFSVYKILPYDKSQIDGNDGSKPIDEISGIIKNQYWIKSFFLSREELDNVISKYPEFTSIGYDKINGVLVKTSATEEKVQEAVKSLELQSGILSVEHRVFTGKKVIKTFKLPDDGSNFNDGGDNWHLEFLNMSDVWNSTTGSKDILIGIEDGGFYYKHEDLYGKFNKIFSLGSSTDNRQHGTAVSGIISALTDNKKGISGINWISRLVVSTFDNDCQNDVPTNYTNILDYNEKVKLINNSWGCMGKTSTTQKGGISKTRTYRKVALSYPNKLHIWAAGNQGTDANIQNGALHLSKDGSYSELKNLIVVTALLKDKKLATYSNYGKTVDIAAPTGFKSTKNSNYNTYYTNENKQDYGTNWSGGFAGTSATTAVVSGVASLIYSIMPNLNASDVKSILINSSDENVTQRYIDNNNSEDFTTKKNGSYPAIPILNAKAAIEMTKDIKDGKIVKVIHKFDNAFKPEATIIISSANNQLHTKETSFDLQSSSSDNNWSFVNSFSGINEIKIPLTNDTYYRVKGRATLDGTSIKPTFDKKFIIPRTVLTVQDSISLKPIADATIKIEPMFLNPTLSLMQKTGTVNSEGKANLYLFSGKYKIIVNATGYPKFTKIVDILEDEVNDIKLTIGDVGNIGGQVVDIAGNPIIGATVRLSGGEQTNGFFTSALTDNSGTYNLSNISKRDSKGNPITSFTLSVSADGYRETIKENVVVLSASSVNYNFTLLAKESTPKTVIYSTSFETNETNWTATGLWHVQQLKTATSVVNTLVDKGFVTLPPDEEAEHAYLPKADDGDNVIWYGRPDTGSYIDIQKEGDSLKSGGTSTSENNGTITSPPIDLNSSTQPILRFKTWWEIEAIAPNENGFDLMDVKISSDNGEFIKIKRLNPHVDPTIENREDKGFSSAGVFRKPIWVQEELDLSQYKGHIIRIQFSFNTKDKQYNGFRGWIIDNLSIIDGNNSDNNESTITSKSYKTKSFFNGFSREYIKVHKEPQTIKENNNPKR